MTTGVAASLQSPLGWVHPKCVAGPTGWPLKQAPSADRAPVPRAAARPQRSGARARCGPGPVQGAGVRPAQAGRITVNRVPSPSALSTQSRPRCRFTICLTMASPRPVPPISRDLWLSTR